MTWQTPQLLQLHLETRRHKDKENGLYDWVLMAGTLQPCKRPDAQHQGDCCSLERKAVDREQKEEEGIWFVCSSVHSGSQRRGCQNWILIFLSKAPAVLAHNCWSLRDVLCWDIDLISLFMFWYQQEWSFCHVYYFSIDYIFLWYKIIQHLFFFDLSFDR